MIHPDAPEKAQAGREVVNFQTSGNARTDVFQTVGKGVSQLQVSGSSSLMHVVATDADAVEFRHVLRCVSENVAHNPHRLRWRVDVGVADHELFQDIVLDGSGKQCLVYALFFGCDDKKGHDREYCPVHRHGDGHFVQWNLVEEHLHVFHRIDGYAGHANVARYAGMIGVVAAVGS